MNAIYTQTVPKAIFNLEFLDFVKESKLHGQNRVNRTFFEIIKMLQNIAFLSFIFALT